MSNRIRYKRQLAAAVAALSGLLVANQANAAILASYTFTSSSTSATSVDPGVAAGSFTQGAGLTGNISSGNPRSGTSTTGNPSAGYFVRPAGVATSEAGAVAGDDFLSITLSAPAASEQLSITNLTFDMTHVANVTGGVGQTLAWSYTAYLRSSDDSYATTLSSVTVNVAAGTQTLNWAGSGRTLGVGGSFPASVDPIEFRLYFAAINSSSGAITDNGTIVRLDNVAVNGAVVVPEPASIAALALGYVGILARRRRTA